MITKLLEKLTAPGNKHFWVGYENYEMTHLRFNPFLNEITCSLCFKFDTSYSTVPFHALLLSYYNIMGNLHVEDINKVPLKSNNTPFDAYDITYVTIPIDKSYR